MTGTLWVGGTAARRTARPTTRPIPRGVLPNLIPDASVTVVMNHNDWVTALEPGARLPSIRSISQEYEVATTTAQKVLEALRDEGLVITSPMGTFVADRS